MSDYLTDEEQVAKLRAWWDDNGKSLAIGVLIVVVGGVGYRWYDDYRTGQNILGSDLYEDFLSSDEESRPDALGNLSEQVGGSSYEVLALLQMAKSGVESGAFDDAEARLRAAVAAAPDGLLRDEARLRMARVLQQLDRTDDALEVLGSIRSSGFRSSVAELQGDIHLLHGERALAHEAYMAAVADLSDSLARPVLEMKLADTKDPSVGEIEEATEAADSAPLATPEPVVGVDEMSASQDDAPDA